ncbi:MAG: hypothetical protein AAGK17_11555 [Pseudomonadota bacterium]
MQKFSIISAAAIALAVGVSSMPAPAEAGPFDSIKKAVKKNKKKADAAEEVIDAVSGTGSTRSLRGNSSSLYKGHKGKAGAPPAKYVGQLNCANLGLGNAFIARGGEYTFSQGLNTEKRTGLIDRKPVTATNGCLFPSMGVGDVLYVELDKGKYEGDKYSYDLQCVSYDGSQQLDRGTRPPADNYKGKDVMLHTGHSLGYTPSASGTNSNRSRAYNEYLDGRGRSMLTFNMPALHTDTGTDFFCQHFNKNTGKVALAFTFRRGPAS